MMQNAQPMVQQPRVPQAQVYAPQAPAQWQAAPAPSKVRGVSGATLTRFVLPSPESLGVTANVTSAPPPQAARTVDWQAIQNRLASLKVLSYDKKPVQEGFRVQIVLPTADP